MKGETKVTFMDKEVQRLLKQTITSCLKDVAGIKLCGGTIMKATEPYVCNKCKFEGNSNDIIFKNNSKKPKILCKACLFSEEKK